MSTAHSMQHRFHHAKGRLIRAVGWVTADRHVEAEGVAELEVERRPTKGEVERAEHEVHASYGESDAQAERARFEQRAAEFADYTGRLGHP